ncbi:Hopanoid-associated sugar epimerase [Parasponia andersonii]|uniref:Hopanoid-associated sugar epimerase n=1 Tax=Parasponia andersonii TaxID=3476 RepID=A0A2P5CM29_PARAD|nr:Hopanoid-associated sugar epimerase [Parasponia andersonii]
MGDSVPVLSEGGPTLIIGSTGFIGRFVAEACLDSGLPTYLLVRPSQNSSCKAATIKILQDKGAIVIHGCIEDQKLMETILKEYKIEVVISTVGGNGISDQLILVKAIKAVGTIKRFLPSEFGHDIDRADPVEPGLAVYNEKRRVRRAVEEARIPYTYICCNSIAAWPYHDNIHPADLHPPLDEFLIYGDGTVKAYFVAGSDIGKFTVKAMNDVRTLNKTVHFRPPSNLFSMNELASLWEKRIGRTLPRLIMTENDLLTAAKELPIPESIVASFTHDIFIKGCQISYSLDMPFDAEVCSLYPETTFQSVEQCFNEVVRKILDAT